MGGAGCCDDKAFAECPQCSGAVGSDSPGAQVLSFGLLDAASSPGQSDFWKASLASEHFRRAALPQSHPETRTISEFVREMDREAAVFGGRLGSQFSGLFHGADVPILLMPIPLPDDGSGDGDTEGDGTEEAVDPCIKEIRKKKKYAKGSCLGVFSIPNPFTKPTPGGGGKAAPST